MKRRALPGLLGLMGISLTGGCGLLESATGEPTMREPVRDGDLRVAKLGDAVVRYEVIAGEAVMQGDISLGPVEELEAAADEARTTGVARSGRGLLALREDVSSVWSWVFGLGERWPNATIPYVIDGTVYKGDDIATVQATLDAVDARLRRQTNLRLVPRTSEPDYVRVRGFLPGENPNGACGRSAVGVKGGEQVLKFVAGGTASCLLHEFLHAFGVKHEQSRPDRNLYVRIQEQNISDGSEGNFDTMDERAFEALGPYDYESTMHYTANAFSRTGTQSCNQANRTGCTIVPRDPAVLVARLGLSDGLTLEDHRGLCRMYGDDDARLDASLGGFDEMSGGVPLYRTAPPTLRLTLTRGATRPDLYFTVESDVDGVLDIPSPLAQPAGGLLRVPLSLRTAGRHRITVTTRSGCPETAELELELEPGGQVVVDREVIDEAARFTVRLETSVTLTAEQRADAQWFYRRLGETVERNLGLGALTAGERFDDVCDGEYEIFVRPAPGPLSASVILPARLTVRDQPDSPPFECRPSVQVVEPADGAGVPRGEDVTLRAVFDDDQPQRDDPVYPVVWIDEASQTELGRGPTLTTTFPQAGTVRLEVRYGSAFDRHRLEVIDGGTPPGVQITRPVANQEFLLDQDVVEVGAGYFLQTPVRALVFHPDGRLPDEDVEWRLTCGSGPTGAGSVVANGASATLDVRVLHADMTRCLLSVRATGPGGLTASDGVAIRIQGPPD